jgi:hypothetical protein
MKITALVLFICIILSAMVDTLLPFYNLSPYLYLHLNKDKIVFIHAGLAVLNKRNILDPINLDNLNRIQETINIQGITLLTGDVWADEIDTNLYNVLFTRDYATHGVDDFGNETPKSRNEICNTITSAGLNLLVVGHCPTIDEGIYQRIELDKKINTNGLYKNCDIGNYPNNDSTKGCLFIDCKDENNIPRLIFIDTGSSLAFRNTRKSQNKDDQNSDIEENKTRGVEILKSSLTALSDSIIILIPLAKSLPFV